MALNITPAYEIICQIIVDNETIVTEQDLANHLKTVDFKYTQDDAQIAYDWSMQAVKRVIIHNFGEKAIL